LPEFTSFVDHLEAFVLFGEGEVKKWLANEKEKQRMGERAYDVDEVFLEAELKVALLVDCGQRRETLQWLHQEKGKEGGTNRSSFARVLPAKRPTQNRQVPHPAHLQ
jgi:hypothetical protein